MKKVYIASPYTIGNMAANVRKQIDCANELINLGYAPFAPLLSHFHDIIHPQLYDTWVKLDLEWVGVCDCLLRLDGESKGADGEVKRAIYLGKPVYYSIGELLRGEK